MQNASFVALSSQIALQRQMDVLANNVANLSTPAFKGEHVLFAQYLAQATPTERIAYVQDVGTTRDTRQGPLSRTGNPLDVALQGDGYLAVQAPDGTHYTRNGHLQLDAQGTLVTSQGYPVLGQGGQPVALPPGSDAVTVGTDGTVATDSGPVGRLQVVEFQQPQAMLAGAGGLYTTAETPQPAAATKVMQGMIEESNVQSVVEMTRLLNAARSAGTIKEMIDGESDRMRDAIEKLGKVV
jgi:flagellar basal-body rod protein FlgF